MGENQGMLWIILGVIVVAAAVMTLGKTMTANTESVTGDIVSETGVGATGE